MTTETGRLDLPLQRADRRGLLWLALAVVAALPLFGFGLAGLAEAWARPEYSHGPVIPLLSFYLFLHEMKAVPPAPAGDRWPGVAVIAAALRAGARSATWCRSTTWSSTR